MKMSVVLILNDDELLHSIVIERDDGTQEIICINGLEAADSSGAGFTEMQYAGESDGPQK